MEYKKENSTIYLRINRGENILETITKVCKKENVCGGYFQGIGACDTMALSSYIPEQNVFADHEFSGMLEMISLMGNISMDCDNQPFLHSHAAFSYWNPKGEIKVPAGHLKEAKISYTGEIIINLSNDKIGRDFDRNAGIEVWKLI